MKLSAYHRQLGDNIVFFKGNYSEYFLNDKINRCIAKIKLQGFELQDWTNFENLVRLYLKSPNQTMIQNIMDLIPFGYPHTVKNILLSYAKKYQCQKVWDRIYITTLFTFYYKEIIDSINFAKKVVKSIDELYVGGVAASLIPEMIGKDTGLTVGRNIIKGLLDKPGMLDDNKIIIDEIVPDYSILETIDYHYPLNTGYLTYMTKGCTRKCKFCAVPILEPEYKDKISVKDQISSISERYGERKDLILMDNNVLGSPKFPEIIQEILEMGFKKNAKFVEPNQFLILTDYLNKSGNQHNEHKYLLKLFDFITEFGNKKIKNSKIRQQYYQLLAEQGLDSLATFKKENLFASRDELNEFIEKYRTKSKKLRYVDFNQGLDCRYIDEEKMKILSQIPIRPMRISFDFLKFRKNYENAVRLADKYGVHNLSNYMLYNYTDKPDDFWKRMKITIDLNGKLKETKIYSFPMKYIPISGKDAINRLYIGKYWNRKYLRAIQVVLTVTKGVVSTNPPFFERAFGKNVEEFNKIMMMPEPYIRNRDYFEKNGQTEEWWYQYQNLNSKELTQVKPIIYSNEFNITCFKNKTIIEFLKHYQVQYRPEKNRKGT